MPEQRLRHLHVWLPSIGSIRTVGAGLVLLLTVLGATPASAQTVRLVTNNNDSGAGSLRQAIIDANTANSDDFILFDGSVTGNIALTSGFLEITHSLTIIGPGAPILAIDGNGASRVFQVDAGATVYIQGLTIQNGNTDDGAGVLNEGVLSLANCTVSGNAATFIGGGIENIDVGALTVTNSTVSGNSASGGGGIANGGTLTMTNSTVSGNLAVGISAAGGGIANGGVLAVLAVNNCTISGNSAPAAAGGGIALGRGTVTMKNTIVANSPSGGNCASVLPMATFISKGHNLSDDNTCSGVLSDTSDLNDTPAGLDAGGLKDNGGSTQTIALLPGSAAVDYIAKSPKDFCTEIDGSTSVSTDQRGVSRPDSEDGAPGKCDIGAFELVEATAAPTATATSTTTATPTAMATTTATATATQTATATATATQTATATPTPTATPTSTPTTNATATATVTATPTATASKTATATDTATAMATPTATTTASATATQTATTTATSTGSSTPTATATLPVTATPTATATSTPTATPTATPVPVTLRFKPKSVEFGKVKLGSMSGPKTVTITNPAPKKHKKGGMAFPVIVMGEVPSPNPFKLENDCQETLPPGQSCKVTLLFEPSMIGKQTGHIVIDDNANKSPQSLTLVGDGT